MGLLVFFLLLFLVGMVVTGLRMYVIRDEKGMTGQQNEMLLIFLLCLVGFIACGAIVLRMIVTGYA